MSETKKHEHPEHAPKTDHIADALKKIEAELEKRLAEHVKVRAKLAEGHPEHAAHNNHAERARKRLGAALGGVVSALQELDAYESIHAEAVAAHAAAEKAKKEAAK